MAAPSAVLKFDLIHFVLLQTLARTRVSFSLSFFLYLEVREPPGSEENLGLSA
jgi:hypothetical protein